MIRLFLLCVSLPVLLWAEATPALKAPKIELAIHDGLEARLFAKEPMVMAPTQVVADHRGRIWVSEAVNYRDDKRRPAGDRIVILEDKNGDGQADHSTVFYQGKDLNGVMGICVLENKVIVSNAPEIFVLEDLDGDDKADKKTVLFTGIGGKQHDHSVHAIAVGPDGKYYFGMGDHGKGLKKANGKPAVDIRGRNPFSFPKGKAFRCDPDGSNLEIIGYNFRNPYELAVDSFGRVWQSDNDNGGSPACRLNHVVGWGNYGYSARARSNGPRTNASPRAEVAHWYQNDPGTMPNLTLVGTGAPTGLCFYEGKLLPKAMQGSPILCEHAQNVVRAFPLHQNGGGYKTTFANVLRGNVSWFRPSDVCVANDGSLFVSDWHDPASGGHRALSSQTGRIYRVAPVGHGYKPTAADLGRTDGLVSAFASPNPVTWAIAAERLRKGNNEAAVQPLLKSADSAIRARAVYLLAGGSKTASMAVEGLSDTDDRVRAATVRAVATAKLPMLLRVVEKAVEDASPQVRREAALALVDLDAKDAKRLWVALARKHKAGDRMTLEVLGAVADGKWDDYLDAWLAAAKWDTPSGHDMLWRAESQKVLRYYVKIISNPKLPLSETIRFFRAFDFQESVDTHLLKLLSLQHPDADEIATYALKHLRKTPIRNAQVKKAVDRLLTGKAGTSSFVTLVRRYNLKDKAPELLKLALDNTNNQLGYDALHALAGFKKLHLLQAAYDAAPDKGPIISLIGNSRSEHAALLLIPQVLNEKNDLALRRQMMEALKHTSKGARGVMPLIVKGKFPKDLEEEAIRILAGCVYANVVDWAVGELAARNGGKEPLSLNKLLAVQGHADAGEKVFDVYCITCHRMDERGIDFGPNLTKVGSKLGRFAMFDAILNPGAGVEFNYETTEVTLKDGGVLIGMTQTESNADVTLKLMGGQTKVVARSNIKKLRRLPGSLMPAGIARGLAPQQLADLVEYLGGKK